VFEDSCEDNITPLQRSLFNLTPRATIIFHLRTDMEDVDESYDWTDRMDILADRVSTLFPLMLNLIEADYILWGSLDHYAYYRITPATLKKKNVKRRFHEHALWWECKFALASIHEPC
jgi:hypothetical protein